MKPHPIISAGWQKLLHFVLPHRCALCDAPSMGTKGLCGPCFGKIQFISQPSCKGCAYPLADTIAGRSIQYCGACLRDGPPFDHAVAASRYNDAIASIILRLKHGDRLDIAPLVSQWMMNAWLASAPPSVDYILPVPLHWKRQLSRRYNQSLELAKPLEEQFGAKLWPDLIIRHRATQQMRQMTRRQRQKNVANAFSLSPQMQQRARELLHGRHVLLVDDVMTSGVTLRAIAGTLRRANVGGVSILVAARVASPEQ